MSKPSPTSLEGQLTRLQKEARIATDLAFSKNAEVKVAQGKLNSLEDEIGRKTIRLLNEQAKTVAEARLQLEADIGAAKDELSSTKDAVRTVKASLVAVTGELSSAEEQLSHVKGEIVAQTRQLGTVKDDVTVMERKLEHLDRDRQTLDTAIDALTTEKSRLNEELPPLREQAALLVGRIDDAEKALAQLTDKRERQIETLDTLILQKTQQLEAMKLEETATRDYLASWERTLGERDTNLRLREAKVQDGESKLVRNADLLNL